VEADLSGARFHGNELLILNEKNLEARVGIEPTHKGFSDLTLFI
jgi:hypothetical protein